MILLLGGSGYVGQAFQNFFQQNNIAFKNISRAEHDYTRPEILRQIIEEIKPDFLVNCAGYTGKPNVDACELHKLETLEGNVIFPGHIMQICNELQLPWGHVSSGCIRTHVVPVQLDSMQCDEFELFVIIHTLFSVENRLDDQNLRHHEIRDESLHNPKLECKLQTR
jgi:hypothetical protein